MVKITRPCVQPALHVSILAGNLSCTWLKENGVCVCLRCNLEKMLRYWTFCDVINPNPGQSLVIGVWLKYTNTTGFWQSPQLQQSLPSSTTVHSYLVTQNWTVFILTSSKLGLPCWRDSQVIFLCFQSHHTITLMRNKIHCKNSKKKIRPQSASVQLLAFSSQFSWRNTHQLYCSTSRAALRPLPSTNVPTYSQTGKLPRFSRGNGMQPTNWGTRSSIVWPDASSGEASKLNQHIGKDTSIHPLETVLFIHNNYLTSWTHLPGIELHTWKVESQWRLL